LSKSCLWYSCFTHVLLFEPINFDAKTVLKVAIASSEREVHDHPKKNKVWNFIDELSPTLTVT
jgi:hypothetical protein